MPRGTGTTATITARPGRPAATAARSRSTARTPRSTSARSEPSTSGGFTLEAWVQKQTSTKNDVAVVGTLGRRRRPDALGRPPRDPLPADDEQRDVQLPRLRPQPDRRPVAASRRHLRPGDATARFYIDGTEVANRSVSVAIGSSNTWRIGAYGSPAGGFFDGLIDDVRIYNRALTAGEITTDMNQPIGFVDPSIPTTPGAFAVTGQLADLDLGAVERIDRRRRASPATGCTRTGRSPGRPPERRSRSRGSPAGRRYTLGVEAFDASNNVSPRAVAERRRRRSATHRPGPWRRTRSTRARGRC